MEKTSAGVLLHRKRCLLAADSQRKKRFGRGSARESAYGLQMGPDVIGLASAFSKQSLHAAYMEDAHVDEAPASLHYLPSQVKDVCNPMPAVAKQEPFNTMPWFSFLAYAVAAAACKMANPTTLGRSLYGLHSFQAADLHWRHPSHALGCRQCLPAA